jgi:hypothetical protein
MDDLMLSKARADYDALQKREAQLSSDLEAVRAKLVKVRDFLELYDHYTADRSAPLAARGGNGRKRSPVRTGIGASVTATAIEVLRDAHRPMKIGELLEAVTAKGHVIGGERPATNLSSILSRSDHVRYEHGIGWNVIEAT